MSSRNNLCNHSSICFIIFSCAAHFPIVIMYSNAAIIFSTVSTCSYLVTLLRQRRKNGAVFVGVRFIPFPYDGELPVGTLEIDVAHKAALLLTRKGAKQKTNLMPPDQNTTTDACLHAIVSRSSWTRSVKFVSSSHFDVDNFIALWSILNPTLAQLNLRIIKEIAHVGDFRELRLDEPWQQKALMCICWLHSEERRLFLKSYESKSASSEKGDIGTRKFEYFLPLFAKVLNNPESFKEQWSTEYDRVVKEYAAVAATPPVVYSNLGCVVVKLPEPAHYYSLFSTSRGSDIVFSMYRGNRYEVEMKYTSIVPLSRPVLPRIDMTPLALHLNNLEKLKRSQRESTTLAVTITDKYYWHCDKVTDSGPILRLESKTKNLKMAERYVHPYERPIYPSLIEPHEMEPIVVSFLTHAYQGVQPRKDFDPIGLEKFNNGIDWKKWAPTL